MSDVNDCYDFEKKETRHSINDMKKYKPKNLQPMIHFNYFSRKMT